MDATNGGRGKLEDLESPRSPRSTEASGTPAIPEDAADPGSPAIPGDAADPGSPAIPGDAADPGSPAIPESAGVGVRSAAPANGPAVRASDHERDAVLQRVQQAFAEGRLDDAEFDERMRAALTARTHADLDVLLTDLPAEPAAPGTPASGGRGPGRRAIAIKSSVRRAGRWRVPERYTTVVYKGGGWLDLRVAELSGPVTTFGAVAYKSRVTILVPPNVRVEMTGFGVTQGATDDEDPGYRLPADAPVIHVRGLAYKGTIEITTRPPERSRPQPSQGPA
jgi:Domain of unknown function (DUF1707)